jgi:hypothetical protein
MRLFFALVPFCCAALDAEIKRAAVAATRLRKASASAAEELRHTKHANFAEDAAAQLMVAAALEETAGFFEPALLPALIALDEAQRVRCVHGSVAEIGVYHGRGFVPLALLRRDGEKAVAIDVFDQQELNKDGSGVGKRAAFEATLRQWGCAHDVVTLSADSTQLDPSTLLDQTNGSSVRLLSIDGSHTAGAVRAVLELAEAVLSDGGVVLLDDALNPDWPGVVTGLVEHVIGGGALRPFALGFNKAFCCLPERAPWSSEVYRSALAPLGRKQAQFLGHPCEILPAGWIAAHYGNDKTSCSR